MNRSNISDWLPTTKKEVEMRGWDRLDVILFSGDAYVDHPSFGVAVIGRVLESIGLKVAIVPQPNWKDDLRDFKKLGKPNLFFGISPGCMDSMVNHYTALKRRRNEDAYTPDRRSDARPDMPTIVYTKILKELFPEIPVVIGGIEASLRRFTHYDYWKDQLKPSILFESGADMLIYGMGERPIIELSNMLTKGIPFHSLTNIPQTSVIRCKDEKYATSKKWATIKLYSHEECLNDKLKYAKNFRFIEEESNSFYASKLVQPIEDKLIIVNPQYPPLSTEVLDTIYALPFTRLPHPKYKGKEIQAYNMIRHSITIHRGCFGGCSFCTISAHQGKFISSRSQQSILNEVEKITEMPDFTGTISDLGGPSANMYMIAGRDLDICKKCKRPTCLHPTICKNLKIDPTPMLNLYREVNSHPRVKHAFVNSGIRYDMHLHKSGDKKLDDLNKEYLKALIRKHVSGRLKVAPEHSSIKVLNYMRKPSFNLFYSLSELFADINKKENLKQQIIPYFISSHPGCELEDMAELAIKTKDLNFKLEQVQDFTPTPMTLATDMYYSGYHPYSLKKVTSAKSILEKKRQNIFFFWYKTDFHNEIVSLLFKLKRKDLVNRLYPERKK